ncbi:hypothetical protein [Pseudomonas orientalis]|uniref:hypothetical protein n=1 Tax=Pseudomonas orientalis TaxID=76758 RepID=UPI0034D709D2
MNEIKERPILFSAPMVRAILQGRKTVTRRVCKPQPPEGHKWRGWVVDSTCSKEIGKASWGDGTGALQRNSVYARCPYGNPGDRLWVRETTEADHGTTNSAVLSRYGADREPVLYSGGGDPEYNGSVAHWDYPRNSRPSIHMQRWACRILLEITDVRVERLQDISRADIRAEGLLCPPELASDDVSPNYRDWYPAAWRELWESTGGDWETNPWVWVVEFKRVTL